MAIKAKNFIIGDKEEPKTPPYQVSKQNSVIITEENNSHYKLIQDGDLVKKHNTKSDYLNDMTGFEF